MFPKYILLGVKLELYGCECAGQMTKLLEGELVDGLTYARNKSILTNTPLSMICYQMP